MKKNKDQKRTKKVTDLPGKLSAEDINKTLSRIGKLLKANREEKTTLPKARYTHYEKGVDMRLSTLLNLLHKLNITPDAFFRELEKLRD